MRPWSFCTSWGHAITVRSPRTLGRMATSLSTSIRHSVRIGGSTKPELLSRLQTAEVQLNAYARALFADPRFVIAPEPSLLSAVEMAVGELGLPQGGTFDRVSQRASEFGFSLCPLEVGPFLRLQLLDQVDDPLGHPGSHGRAPPGSVTIASSPISCNEDDPKGFYLRRVNGVLWLRGYRSWAGHVLAPDDRLVFCQSTNTA